MVAVSRWEWIPDAEDCVNRVTNGLIVEQAAYQKQDKFSYRKVHVLGKKTNQRWYADIGLGIKTPEMAIRGKYIDKKCPFTSSVSIRGAILKGLVISHEDGAHHHRAS